MNLKLIAVTALGILATAGAAWLLLAPSNSTPAIDCQQQVHQVKQGNLPPENVSTDCRTNMTGEKWEQIYNEYLRTKTVDTISGG